MERVVCHVERDGNLVGKTFGESVEESATTGTPAEVAKSRKGYTHNYLKEELKR